MTSPTRNLSEVTLPDGWFVTGVLSRPLYSKAVHSDNRHGAPQMPGQKSVNLPIRVRDHVHQVGTACKLLPNAYP